MNKKQLDTFIKKYNLGGTIDQAIWSNDGSDNLRVTAMTSDKRMFVDVNLEKGADFFKGVEIGIQDAVKFKKMLVLFEDDIKVNLDVDEKDATRVRRLLVEDTDNSFEYVTAAPTAIEPAPKMKTLPPFTIEIKLTPKFIDSFNKAFAALSDDDTLFTMLMSKKKQKLEMVLGFKQNLSDRIALGVETTAGKDTIKTPISFNAKNLKEILAANSDVTDASLNISEAGLASILFVKDGFKSQYYMVKTEVEN